MLYAITLRYSRPIEDINHQLASHKNWLVNYIKQGTILVAGPTADEKGGFILAQADNLATIENMVATDPYAIHQLATFDIVGCSPAIRASQFPEPWAAGAVAL